MTTDFERSICTAAWLRTIAFPPLPPKFVQPRGRRQVVPPVQRRQGIEELESGGQPVLSWNRAQHLPDEVAGRVGRQPFAAFGTLLEVPAAQLCERFPVGYLTPGDQVVDPTVADANFQGRLAYGRLLDPTAHGVAEELDLVFTVHVVPLPHFVGEGRHDRVPAGSPDWL